MSNLGVPQPGAHGVGAQWHQLVGQETQQGGLLTKVMDAMTRLVEAFTTTPTRSTAQLINTQEAFKSFYRAEVGKLADSVSPQDLQAFSDRAEDLFAQIIAGSFREGHDQAIYLGGQVTDYMLRNVIQTANKKANLALMDLTAHAKRSAIGARPKGDIRPQVFQPQLGGQFRIIRQTPQIENLVFRGGGAKGIGNPAALVEMENCGILSGLKKIVGTSAGALTAICLASGLSAKKFQEFSDNIEMDSIKQKPDNFSELYPQVKLSVTGYHAGTALELGDKISAESVQQHLNKHWDEPDFQQKLKLLPESDQMRLVLLRKQDFTVERTNQMVTFKDLRLMNQLAPSQFKELTLTGWQNTALFQSLDKWYEPGREVYFDADKTPDMPVAVAGRISMSIPMFFASVKFDPKDGHGQREFTDGGVGSNMPTEVIFKDLQGAQLDEAHARTLLMTFDEQGKAYNVLHGDDQSRATGAKLRDKLLSGKTDESANADREKTYDAGPNAFVIFHGDIDTLDLDASEERQQFAKLQSQVKTLEQIEIRQNQAYLQEFESVEVAFDNLTDIEKLALREGPAPSENDYEYGAWDLDYQATKDLYDLAIGGR